MNKDSNDSRLFNYAQGMKGKKVYVAMSGGVDSSVAALLLQQQGYSVTGVFMRNWHADIHDGFMGDCPWEQDWADVQAVCKILRIPCQMWDFSNEYYEEVVSYFFREYEAGRTPNPDVMCNKYIKFGKFLERALEEGADLVATGHYTRLRREFQISNFKFSKKQNKNNQNFKEKKYQLLVGLDSNKDQSYFLWTLTQNQLKHSLFPVGDYAKPEIRKLAKDADLPIHAKKDSQGICFIGNIDVQKFLGSRLAEKIGDIVTANGEKIGEHKGAHFYTEGQREGLELGGQPFPYYVLSKDVKKNIITVVPAYDKKLFVESLTASEVNWVSDNEPSFPLLCKARIRYRQDLQGCTVNKSDKKLHVVFSSPQRAISPGQSVVFYEGDECLGGGVIN